MTSPETQKGSQRNLARDTEEGEKTGCIPSTTQSFSSSASLRPRSGSAQEISNQNTTQKIDETISTESNSL